MAQWSGQYSGLTHDTKVKDAEVSLRKAVESLSRLSTTDRSGKMKHIRSLAERLLAARLKAMRARLSSLTEPGSTNLDAEQTSSLRARKEGVEAHGVEAILKEFGAT